MVQGSAAGLEEPILEAKGTLYVSLQQRPIIYAVGMVGGILADRSAEIHDVASAEPFGEYSGTPGS